MDRDARSLRARILASGKHEQGRYVRNGDREVGPYAVKGR